MAAGNDNGGERGTSNANASTSKGVWVPDKLVVGPTKAALQHNAHIADEWTPEEESVVEELLAKYATESKMYRYAQITMQLKDKCLRHLVLRCRRMSESAAHGGNQQHMKRGKARTIENTPVSWQLGGDVSHGTTVAKSSTGDAEASASSMQNGEIQDGTIGAGDANRSAGNTVKINVTTPAVNQIETPVKLSGEEMPQLMQDWVEMVESFSKLSLADEVEASPELNSKCSVWDNLVIAKKNGMGRNDHISRENKDKKDKLTDSMPKLTDVGSRTNGPPYAPAVMPIDSDGRISYQAIGGSIEQLLEQNAQALEQISANLDAVKIQENINLLFQARNNLLNVVNNLNDDSEIMRLMPPLPVKLNEELANSILPQPPSFLDKS